MTDAKLACVNKIFPNWNTGGVGVAVDVGANDGLFQNWSLSLERAGWRVLCIEGNPKHMDALSARRKEAVLEVIGAVDGEDKEFIVYHSPNEASYSGIVERPPGKPVANRFDVKTKMLSTCLIEHDIEHVDILGLDIEGGELDALSPFDFKRWGPKLIFCEQRVHKEELEALFTQNGYVVIGVDAWDAIWGLADA